MDDYEPRYMDDDEPILLHEPDLMLAILRVAQNGPATLDMARQRLEAIRAQAHEPAPDDLQDLQARLRHAALMLGAAGAIAPVGEGGLRLTERGRQLLREHPDGVDQTTLRVFPEFRAALAEIGSRRGPLDDPRLSAFDAGMNAFNKGRPHVDNPYPSDTNDHLAWECGWCEARDAAIRR